VWQEDVAVNLVRSSQSVTRFVVEGRKGDPQGLAALIVERLGQAIEKIPISTTQ